MNRERLKGHLDLLLLSSLSAGPAHGYAVIAALRDRSEGTFDLPEGTIYPALHRLEDAGLLGSSWADAGGRRRRVYEARLAFLAGVHRELPGVACSPEADRVAGR